MKAEAEATAPSCTLSAWMNRFGYLINEYYRLDKAGVPDEHFPDCLKRLYLITDTESPDDLAACPPIQVDEAVRQSRIPAWWLLYLAARRSISPQWLLTGEGTPFFRSALPSCPSLTRRSEARMDIPLLFFNSEEE